MLLMSSSIVYSQTTLTDSLKCFSYSQAKQIMKDLKRGEICDSISQNQELQIINFKSILSKSNEQINLLQTNNDELNKSLLNANRRLKMSVSLTKYGIPIGIGAGFIVGILIR